MLSDDPITRYAGAVTDQGSMNEADLTAAERIEDCLRAYEFALWCLHRRVQTVKGEAPLWRPVWIIDTADRFAGDGE